YDPSSGVSVDSILYGSAYGKPGTTAADKSNSAPQSIEPVPITREQKAKELFSTIDIAFDKADLNQDCKLQPNEIHEFKQRTGISDHERAAFTFLDDIRRMDPKVDATLTEKISLAPMELVLTATHGDCFTRSDLEFFHKLVDPSILEEPIPSIM